MAIYFNQDFREFLRFLYNMLCFTWGRRLLLEWLWKEICISYNTHFKRFKSTENSQEKSMNTSNPTFTHLLITNISTFAFFFYGQPLSASTIWESVTDIQTATKYLSILFTSGKTSSCTTTVHSLSQLLFTSLLIVDIASLNHLKSSKASQIRHSVS